MESNEPTGRAASRSRVRFWARMGAAVLLLLALALTPPLLNVNRLQRRIVMSMSESLGRPVHLDPPITLHLLPMPSLTLNNLVVSEDPQFGAEPTIRANQVEVTLRPSSLWRRQVEVASIRFVEPSLNLVRNADGRWNVESLLMHASQLDAAPTVQKKAGPAPRFPYIDATNARINVKMGDEKMPFSLTETDFALWLPSPNTWRVQIEGKPARTDTSIDNPGLIRIDGSLQRAADVRDVPIQLHASWHDAPLGAVTRVLTGDDGGWRGVLLADFDLSGTIAQAQVNGKLTVNDLRKADFVPAHAMDVAPQCTGTLNVTTAIVSAPQCVLHDGGDGMVNAIADSLDLTGLKVKGFQIASPGVSEAWLLDWARLFWQKLPDDEQGIGKVTGALTYVPGVNAAPAYWQGDLHGALPPLDNPEGLEPPQFSIVADQDGFELPAVDLLPAKSQALTLSGLADMKHYSLRLNGQATIDQLKRLGSVLPPLGESLRTVMPEDAKAADGPAKIDVTCSRTYGDAETCTAGTPETAKTSRRKR